MGGKRTLAHGSDVTYQGRMNKVQWLWALSFVLLLGGSLYNLRMGSVTAAPWTFSRQQRPMGFYATVLAILAAGAIAILTVWVISLRQAANISVASSVVAAKRVCQHVKHEQMGVGISDYEACLGQQANLTRPASRELCAMAKSDMSADGFCILGQ